MRDTITTLGLFFLLIIIAALCAKELHGTSFTSDRFFPYISLQTAIVCMIAGTPLYGKPNPPIILDLEGAFLALFFVALFYDWSPYHSFSKAAYGAAIAAAITGLVWAVLSRMNTPERTAAYTHGHLLRFGVLSVLALGFAYLYFTWWRGMDWQPALLCTLGFGVAGNCMQRIAVLNAPSLKHRLGWWVSVGAIAFFIGTGFEPDADKAAQAWLIYFGMMAGFFCLAQLRAVLQQKQST